MSHKDEFCERWITFHPKLPVFRYSPWNTDKLTTLYAAHLAHSYKAFGPLDDKYKLTKVRSWRNQIDQLHRRRFLKAFAKYHIERENSDYYLDDAEYSRHYRFTCALRKNAERSREDRNVLCEIASIKYRTALSKLNPARLP